MKKEKNKKAVIISLIFYFIFYFLFFISFNGCASNAASAEEYFSIGMAFFELGRYEEAERWLNRAKSADKTMVASQYNLGRLAFEMQRFKEAAEYFEEILKRDPDNVLALRSASYSRIRNGDFDIAARHYNRLLELVPENADDGYNHALVLFAMGRYGEAQEVLERYPIPLQDNNDFLLLYARSLAAQNKIEAIDSYSVYLSNNSNARVRFEYAQALEQHELFARAMEEYRKAISETPATDAASRREIRFTLAKMLLTADSENNTGIIELQTAIVEGFDDVAAVEELLDSGKVSAANLESIRNIIAEMRNNLRVTP